MKIKLTKVQIAFPTIWEPKAGMDGAGNPAYSASFILHPDDPQVAKIEAAIEAVAREKWPKEFQQLLKNFKATDKLCLHSGDLKSQYQGFAGNLYLSTRSPVKPLVLDRDKTPLTERSGVVYAGAFVNMVGDIWAQDSKAFGRRINCGLQGIQFHSAGQAFGGAVPADVSDFDELEPLEADFL